MSRQRNVQQQNALAFDSMLALARHFRARGVPRAVRECLAARGIDIDTSVMLQATSEGYASWSDFAGMLLTADQRFFRFELDGAMAVAVLQTINAG